MMDELRIRRASCDLGCTLAIFLSMVGTATLVAGDDEPTVDGPPASASQEAYETVMMRGRVVWLAEALARRYGIETDADATEANVAIETPDGVIWPIVKDFRGRGFFLDERLRDVEMELLVRRFAGSPVVQIVRTYTMDGQDRYLLDYWCDICAIPMYELKACECCQGATRLRERLVVDGEPTDQERE